MKRRIPISALGLSLMSACVPAVRPVPNVANVSIPPAWTQQGEPEGTISQAWWRDFHDETLNGYVARALANNNDILSAIARVDEAQESLALARSALLPTLDADASAARSRSLEATGVTTSTAIQPEVNLSWQADLFGQLRAQRKAAEYQFQASKADRDGVALTVASSVVQAYVALLSLDAQLQLTRKTLETRRESRRLAQDQADAGYTSQFELTQAQSEYESVAGDIPELEGAIRNAEHALSLLCGDVPTATVARGKLVDINIPAVPTVMPSTLLNRRPDLASAADALAASDASLAAQRAAFLPSVNLSASFGQLFVDALNYDPVSIWNIGGSILAPIFEGGKLRANLNVATARRDQAAFAYRGAVLSAFGDVENALTNVQRYGQQIGVVRNRLTILLRSLDLATDRYRSGYASYIDQLDAQRNLYSTEIQAINLRQQ